MTATEATLAKQVGKCEYCQGECCNCDKCVSVKGRLNICSPCKSRLEKIHAKV